MQDKSQLLTLLLKIFSFCICIVSLSIFIFASLFYQRFPFYIPSVFNAQNEIMATN